jgi:cytochrome c-type biogenesis protein CcmH
MTWVFVFLLAALAFCVIAWLLKAPRSGWEAIGAALLFGIAGYGLQGSPGLAGAPKPAAERLSGDPAALVEARRGLSGDKQLPADNWLVVGDALARNGQYANAASVLLGAVKKEPRNGEAWLAMANALVGHADGQLTPAALFAYHHAAEVAPHNPGPPFFLGLALAQSGRLAEARQLWGDLLEHTPADAPWRSDLEMRIARLDAFIASRGQAPPTR